MQPIPGAAGLSGSRCTESDSFRIDRWQLHRLSVTVTTAERREHTIDERNARAVWTPLAHAVEITLEEVGSANLETLLNHFGSELIHAVADGMTENVLNSAAAVGRLALLANVLNAPVSELATGDDIDSSKNLVDARALRRNQHLTRSGVESRLTLSSSKQFSKMF